MSKPQSSNKPQRVNVHAHVTRRITEQARQRVCSSSIKLAFARATGLL